MITCIYTNLAITQPDDFWHRSATNQTQMLVQRLHSSNNNIVQ